MRIDRIDGVLGGAQHDIGLEVIRKWVLDNVSGTVLDVRCGEGKLLRLIRERCRCVGLELSFEACGKEKIRSSCTRKCLLSPI